MADQNNDGRGALFRIPEADKKNDRWPDYRGDITIEGVKWKLAGWIKADKNGGKFLSISAKPFEERRQEEPRAQSQQSNDYAAAKGRGGGPSFDRDEIPFLPDR